MPPSSPATETCAICPTPRIHRVHEQLDQFEFLRSLRRDQRVEVWAGRILATIPRGKKRKRADLEAAIDKADHLAWELQQQVERELRDD
jgi:hypothetical protein